jgi:predicted DNA-binding transcriptional regulator AlpA
MQHGDTPDPLLRINQFIGIPVGSATPMLPISRASWFAGIKAGKYPPPDVRLGARTVLWKQSTIRRLIDSLAAGQSGTEA